MKKQLPLLAPLTLAGCFATAQPFYLPDGSQGYRLDCSQYMGGTADCLQKAGDICGVNGYQMFDQNGRLKNEDSENQTVIATINNSATKPTAAAHTLKPAAASNEPGKTMFIKCRTAETVPRLTPAGVPAVESKSTMPNSRPPSDAGPIPLHSNN